MPNTTMTEQSLCTMWAATAHGGDWLDLSITLQRIATVLYAQATEFGGSPGIESAAAMFADAADLAAARRVYDIVMRKAA